MRHGGFALPFGEDNLSFSLEMDRGKKKRKENLALVSPSIDKVGVPL